MKKIPVVFTDAAYQRIIAANGKRVRGSVAMITPEEFEFNIGAKPGPRPPRPNRVLNMKHGKATIAPDRMRVYIMVKTKDESHPIDIICEETDEAVDFFTAN